MGGGNGCKSAAKREKNMVKLQKAGKQKSQKDAVKNQPVSSHPHYTSLLHAVKCRLLLPTSALHSLRYRTAC